MHVEDLSQSKIRPWILSLYYQRGQPKPAAYAYAFERVVVYFPWLAERASEPPAATSAPSGDIATA